MITTCKDCDHRYPACWGSCPEYLAAKAEYDKQKQSEIKHRTANAVIDSVQYHGLRGNVKR